MMQEVGKTNVSCLKILSIQLQLGGLSFYCGKNRKYGFRQIGDTHEIAQVIAKEVHGEEYQIVNYYHNSPDYIIIPRELFDENMCDAYLLTKGIRPSSDEIISVTLTDDIAYLSCTQRAITMVEGVEVNVYPILAKCYRFCRGFESNVIAYIIEDNMLHIGFSERGNVKFCETLPLSSATDFEFFLSRVIKKYCVKGGSAKIISLYENGTFCVARNVLTRYKIKSISQENYYEI